jgi:hypothetical protein
VDLGEMGEILLRRMAGFRNHLGRCSFHSDLLFLCLNTTQCGHQTLTIRSCV